MVVAQSTQEQIKKAHALAIEKGYSTKAEVLKRFICNEENDGRQINNRRRPRFIAKHLDRRRGPKINRPHKNPALRLPEQEAVAVSQD